MSAINSSQDLVNNIDFTSLGTQTAAEHNQLVTLATPWAASSAVGVGLVLCTTDTAANTPDVPDPTQSSAYNKWTRYLWSRRPFAGQTDKTGWLYQWNDDANNDATYKKWQLSDKASQTTVGGSLGTPLQTAINNLNTITNNANTAAIAANTSVSALQFACLGTTSPIGFTPDLNTQIGTNTTNIATNATNIALINTAIGGTDGLSGTGGINGQIAALQTALNTEVAAAANVANLTPGTVVGSMLRTGKSSSLGVGNPEWYDPTSSTNNELIVLQATGTTLGLVGTSAAGTDITPTSPPSLTAGTYLIDVTLCGNFKGSGTNAANNSLRIDVVLGAVTITGMTNYNNGTAASGMFRCIGTALITDAAAPKAFSVKAYSGSNASLDVNGVYLVAVIRKISLKSA